MGRYRTRLKCVNVCSHIWKKRRRKNAKWQFSKVFSSFWVDILYISPFFDNQNKYFDCSAKFNFLNITKILNLENRRMMINIFLPSWYLCWYSISLESITRTVVVHSTYANIWKKKYKKVQKIVGIGWIGSLLYKSE